MKISDITQWTDPLLEFVSRVCNILATPKDEWDVIATEPTTIRQLYLRYVIPLAAIDPIFSYIGMVHVGVGGMYLKPPLVAFVTVMTSYIVMLIGVMVIAVVVNGLASMVGGEANLLQAVKLTTFSYTPAWLACIMYAIPSAGLIALLGGFYGLYLAYLGFPKIMKTPKSSVVGCTIVMAILATGVGVAPFALPKLNLAIPSVSIQWSSPGGKSQAAPQPQRQPVRQPSRQSQQRHELPPDRPLDVPLEAPPPLR